MRHLGCARTRDNRAQGIPKKSSSGFSHSKFKELPVIKTIFLPVWYLKICPHSSTRYKRESQTVSRHLEMRKLVNQKSIKWKIGDNISRAYSNLIYKLLFLIDFCISPLLNSEAAFSMTGNSTTPHSHCQSIKNHTLGPKALQNSENTTWIILVWDLGVHFFNLLSPNIDVLPQNQAFKHSHN